MQLEQKKSSWKKLELNIKRERSHFKLNPGILIIDLKEDWKIAYQQDRAYPSASLVKIPIMAVCFYALAASKINLDQKVRMESSDRVIGSGVLKTMPPGKEFSVKELIALMITESDNTATNMLIELLGVDYLNSCFKRFGLKNTNLVRKMMDFKSRRKGVENYTTCRDIGLLLLRIYRGQLLSREASLECLELLKKQKMKDRIPAKLPANLVIAHKTGLERRICHDAGIVFTDKGNFIICVLTRHRYKTARFAKEFIARVARDVYDYFQRF